MASMTITLTDEQPALAARRAAECSCPDVKSYVEQLVADNIAPDEDYGAPEHLSPKTREQFDALIAEGLDSPAREMTRADWDEMRRQLIDRARKSEGG